MLLSAFICLNRSVDFKFPVHVVIPAISGLADEVLISFDPSFQDGTKGQIESICQKLPNTTIISDEWDFDSKNPLGGQKNKIRKMLSGEWVLEWEPYWFPGKVSKKFLFEKLATANQSCLSMQLGSIPFFNGNFLKLAHPTAELVISRNIPGMSHAGPGRNGCSLEYNGLSLKASVYLYKIKYGKPDLNETGDESSWWIYNYEWFSLPNQWEQKNYLHFFKGMLTGEYKSLSDYTKNMDEEPVDMFGRHIELPLEYYEMDIFSEIYDEEVAGELKPKPGIVPFRGTHPPEMQEWCKNQRVMSLLKDDRIKPGGRIRKALNVLFRKEA